jgi:hypothetical protein
MRPTSRTSRLDSDIVDQPSSGPGLTSSFSRLHTFRDHPHTRQRRQHTSSARLTYGREDQTFQERRPASGCRRSTTGLAKVANAIMKVTSRHARLTNGRRSLTSFVAEVNKADEELTWASEDLTSSCGCLTKALARLRTVRCLLSSSIAKCCNAHLVIIGDRCRFHGTTLYPVWPRQCGGSAVVPSCHRNEMLPQNAPSHIHRE